MKQDSGDNMDRIVSMLKRQDDDSDEDDYYPTPRPEDEMFIGKKQSHNVSF
jgi:hypothetical protein